MAQANIAPITQKPGTVELKPDSLTAAVSAIAASATTRSATTQAVVRRAKE